MGELTPPKSSTPTDQLVRLQFGDRQIFRIERRLPAVLVRDLPGGAARHSIAEQAHLELRESLVALECLCFADVTAAHTREQERERLRADEVRGNELMRRIDLHPLGDQVEQRRRIDHVASHLRTVRVSAASPAHHRHERLWGHSIRRIAPRFVSPAGCYTPSAYSVYPTSSPLTA